MDKRNIDKELSASALAKELNKTTQAVFQQLLDFGLITKNENSWELTVEGKRQGGIYKDTEKYGKYIVWPESIKAKLENITAIERNPILLTATSIGKHFEIQTTRVNPILSELGWIKKDIKGWQVTDLGKRLGGVQSKDKQSGVPFVRWPESIINNKIFVTSINESKGETTVTNQEQLQSSGKDELDFREKFPPKNRATDGHYVRSKAELLIDNWLYMSEILHAYERKLPVEEDIYSDFYIPKEKVYIEFWGYEDDSKYLSRKERKLEIYKKYNFKLIQLTDKEVQNLDDSLPRLLLEFGIRTD